MKFPAACTKTPDMKKAGMEHTDPSQGGFSFVELMVVIMILSALAFITLPNFSRLHSPGDGGNSGDHEALASLMATLRTRAVQEGQDQILHLDQTTGKIWVTGEAGSQDRENTEQTEAQRTFSFPVAGVELPGRPEPDPTDTRIRFYRQGHADAALIHLESRESDFTLRLHPFLQQPEIIQGYARFDDCR